MENVFYDCLQYSLEITKNFASEKFGILSDDWEEYY